MHGNALASKVHGWVVLPPLLGLPPVPPLPLGAAPPAPSLVADVHAWPTALSVRCARALLARSMGRPAWKRTLEAYCARVETG